MYILNKNVTSQTKKHDQVNGFPHQALVLEKGARLLPKKI